jgi:hypothetical protein
MKGDDSPRIARTDALAQAGSPDPFGFDKFLDDDLAAFTPVREGIFLCREHETAVGQARDELLARCCAHRGLCPNDMGKPTPDLLQQQDARPRVGHAHFGRLRGSRGARVGREVDQRKVDLVPHRAHDGNAA